MLVDNPILNSPFEEPARYWAYEEGQPVLKEGRRPAGYYLKARTRGPHIAILEEEFVPLDLVNAIRERVKAWREKGYPGVTSITRQLLNLWSNPERERRLFFCQREAVETLIWLVELLRKLLEGEIKTRRRKNLVQARSFAEMLEQTIRRYQNRAIEAAQVIEELIALAKEMRAASSRGEVLGLSEEELAFYDALETNDSAVKVLGEPKLRQIAQELVRTVRANVTIDWTLRENVRAQLRVLVKRILRKHGYPPDKQETAATTVLQQAELLCQNWTAG